MSYLKKSKDQQLAKYYLAIANGKPNKKQGAIKGDIVKARRGSYKLAKTLENPSKTQFISCLIEPSKGYICSNLLLVKLIN